MNFNFAQKLDFVKSVTAALLPGTAMFAGCTVAPPITADTSYSHHLNVEIDAPEDTGPHESVGFTQNLNKVPVSVLLLSPYAPMGIGKASGLSRYRVMAK